MGAHDCKSNCNCAKARCKTCLDLDWNFYPEDSGLFPDRDIFTNIGNISESAAMGCKTCDILNTGVSTFIEMLIEKSPEYEDEVYAASVQINIRRGHTLEVCLFGVDDTLLQLEFYSHLGHSMPWPAFGPAEEIIPTLDLGTCYKFARTWIDNCEKNHFNSCFQGECKLPKRVLDLGIDGTATMLKLKETEAEMGRYITLSHCWGNIDDQLSTKKANKSNMLHGIPIHELCQTFKDAIAITRKLGIRYLWIDSLCIIQDDPQDWKQESGKMADIYSSSYLTLAATHAASGKQGCFSTRWTMGSSQLNLPRMRSKTITVPFNLSEEGQEGQVFVRHRHHLAHEDIASLSLVSREISPLLTRAWVLQELLLSSRILHFHAEEMVWECKGSSACECSFLDPPTLSNTSTSSCATFMRNDNKQLRMEKSASYQSLSDHYIRSLFSQLCDPVRIQELKSSPWLKIVSQYTKLDLTKETDRIMALSGLAKAASMNRNSSDRYLAGMWEEDLDESLLWAVPWAHKRPVTRSPQSSNPTWSWTSVHFSGPPPHRNLVNLGWSLRGPTGDETPNVTFSFYDMKAVCEPEDGNLFGPVTGGLLTIRGTYIIAKASYGYYGDEDFPRIIVDFRGQKELVVSDISPIVALSPAELKTDVVCLLMGRNKRPQSEHSLYFGGPHFAIWNICMVLKASPSKPGKYERFGLLYNQTDCSWFIDALEKTFEIT